MLDLLKFGTIRAVAAYLGVGWDMVKEIHKDRLSMLYRKIPLREVRYIGIDEFSLKKGHEYMTIFTDLETGRILHAVEGRSKDDIRPFIEKLSKKAKKLKAVAMDKVVLAGVVDADRIDRTPLSEGRNWGQRRISA